MVRQKIRYVELQCKSNFSFLEGASHAHELVEQAHELGYHGLAITDRNTLTGIVRAHTAAKDLSLPFVVGSELHPVDGPPVVLWPQSRKGYASLCKILSIGRLRADKGDCRLSWHDIVQHSTECMAGFVPRLLDAPIANTPDRVSLDPDSPLAVNPIPSVPWCEAGAQFDSKDPKPWTRWLNQFREVFGPRGYLIASLHRGVDDAASLARWMKISSDSNVPIVATGD